ncbi:AMP-dependent synthetase and ligase [Caldicellulosiruptor hydrothermalis 108]|uniref:AMP-dependent synthetase and ligase n=1 Tax=Caldicellulosiruptor hydrothermalis (strain DSM 18901 / VKM B-2411 / 108) TaxID=632292 RepID=E4QDJ0_CALH1|nr:AMP-binding protein [Caldicellulosiruptor hydrothermalis]ADQ07608.1 AMP-dependent synthetase and ligase [Caldicellulosiruptor hydrothermalis 108]
MSLIEMTIPDYFDMIATKFADNPAVIYHHEKIYLTYSQFKKMVDDAAKGFMAIGIQKGEHVAVWATNRLEYLISIFALAKIGAVLVTVNTNYKIYELEYLLKQSDSSTLIFTEGFKDSNYLEIVKKLNPQLQACKKGELENPNLPYLKRLIFVGQGSYDGIYNWHEVIELGKDVSDEKLIRRQKSLEPDEVINMQYTSGTTGFPKGVMLTHKNILNNANAIADCMKLTHKDKLCIPVPFFHCFGLVLGIGACMTKGATMVPLDHFNPLKVMETIHFERCTGLHGVPTMFIAILQHPEFDKFNFSSLRTGIMAGAPCPIKVMREVVEKMHMREITIAYGQTEASPVITQTRVDDPLEFRVSTVGKPLEGVEVKIVDIHTKKEVPNGVVGEICARGYNVMKGYYKMPEATKQAIDEDGWLHTGDLGYIDQNGYLRITGRLKDMIIRGGENIYPREIEEFLYSHPAVKDVQVVGVPDKVYGEEIVAFIILKDGSCASEEEIKEFVKANLSRHKTPRYVVFVNEFPTTANGKVQKYKLREMAIEKFGLHDAANIETA